jgi:hypothetical protein
MMPCSLAYGSSETFIPIYQTIWCHNPEDRYLKRVNFFTYGQTENTTSSVKYTNGDSKNAGIGEELISD